MRNWKLLAMILMAVAALSMGTAWAQPPAEQEAPAEQVEPVQQPAVDEVSRRGRGRRRGDRGGRAGSRGGGGRGCRADADPDRAVRRRALRIANVADRPRIVDSTVCRRWTRR